MTGVESHASDTGIDPILGHLRARGLVGSEPVRLEALGGGVSCSVVLAATAERSFVVKSAYPQLRVDEEWLADPRRTATEYEALVFASTVHPAGVPRVIDYDDAANTLIIEAAPPDWSNWKAELLAGSVIDHAASDLGSMMASIHATAPERRLELSRVTATNSFAELRGDPYFEAAAARVPSVAELLRQQNRWLQSDGVTLVHGDLSPKNVLIGPRRTWLIDWEAAHWGRPEFDLAFLCTHLLLKTVHRPGDAAELTRVATRFLGSYRSSVTGTTMGVADSSTSAGDRLSRLVGALVLARLHGRSRVEYLSPSTTATAHELGESLITGCSGLFDAFAAVPGGDA